MKTNKQMFKKEMSKLLLELNMNINYSINENENKYDILYVSKFSNEFIFNINFNKIPKKFLKIFLYHELYHVKQYINNFPLLVIDNDKIRYSIIQKVITDLFVTKKMIEENKFKNAYKLFKYRIKNTYKKINILNTIEDEENMFRVAYIVAESEIFFKRFKYCKIKTDKIKCMLFNDKINRIYNIITEELKENNVEKMYYRLIKEIDNRVSINTFENYILII